MNPTSVLAVKYSQHCAHTPSTAQDTVQAVHTSELISRLSCQHCNMSYTLPAAVW